MIDAPIRESLLATLNPEQARAVSAERGNILVLAGAGSGKTRVLVHRIAWLLEVEQLQPYNVLAVTFTNKAANEMKRRIADLLQRPIGDMWVGTFHGLANRMLRVHHEAVGLDADFQIIDGEDQKRLVKRVLAEQNVDEKNVPVKQLMGYVNSCKDSCLRADAALEQARDYREQALAQLYQAYEDACRRGQIVDFAELLLRSYELLGRKEILARFQQRFRELLVDEFQDTNTIQYQWLRRLCGANSHIMAVGDDDQSIYGWRGARIANIRAFTSDMPGAQVVRSEQNYRSTDTILQAANALISNNDNRLGKNLWTDLGLGESISYYRSFNAQDEADYVVKTLLKTCEHNDWRLSDCALLYRSNAQSRSLEEALLQRGLPYRIYGGQKFYERLEIKDTLAYARLMVNRHDDTAVERVINTPARGLGDRTLQQLRGFARAQECSLWQAILTHADGAASGRAQQALGEFIKLLEDLEALSASMTLAETIDLIADHSGLLAMYSKQRDGRAETRRENIEELVSAAGQFVVPEGGSGLPEFLQQVALESGEQAEANSDAVQLMTLHSAKGLEFLLVFIVGFEEGLLPHYGSLQEARKVEEERRLTYVGITRAMRKLVLTSSENRMIAGRTDSNPASRFLFEIPKELVSADKPKRGGVSSWQRPRGGGLFQRGGQANARVASEAVEPVNARFHLGQRVQHAVFGFGVVARYEQGGSGDRVLVRFERAGEKWLLLDFANLTAA